MDTLIILSAAIGSGSYMLSQAQVFSFLRQWVIRRTNPMAERKHRKLWVWLNHLLNCPFCVSVWLSLGAVVIYRPRLVRMWEPLDLLVEALALSSGAMLAVAVIRKALGK